MPAGNPGGYARGGSNAAVQKMLKELGNQPRGRARAAAVRSPEGLSGSAAGGGGGLMEALQMPQGGGMSDQGKNNVARATRMLGNKDPGTSMKDAISGEFGGEMDMLRMLGGGLKGGLAEIGSLLTGLLGLI